MEREIVTKDSWKTVEIPEEHTNIELGLTLNIDEMEIIKKGHRPETMEDHWFIYFENGQLFIHRSWTGFCVYIIDIDNNGNIKSAIVNRNESQYKNNNDEYDQYMIGYLVYSMVGRKKEAEEMLDKTHIIEKQKYKRKDEIEFSDWIDKEETNNTAIKDFINSVIDRDVIEEKDEEFEKYCALYKEKFGKDAYIAEPSGTKQQTIEAIKLCLKENQDMLDKIYYPDIYKKTFIEKVKDFFKRIFRITNK